MWAAIRDAKFLKVSNGFPTDSLWLMADYWDTQADAVDGTGVPLMRQQFDIQLNFAARQRVTVDQNQDGKPDSYVRLDGVLVYGDQVTKLDEAIGFQETFAPFTSEQIKSRILGPVVEQVKVILANKSAKTEFDKLAAEKVATIKTAFRERLVVRRDAAIADKRPGLAAAEQARIDAWDAKTEDAKKDEAIRPLLDALTPTPKTPQNIFTVDDADTRQALPTVLSALGALPLIWEVP